MNIEEFDFYLPDNLIAQKPIEPRHNAKLLCVHGEELSSSMVYNLDKILKSGDILVFNDTKVIKSRITGKRGDAKIVMTLHKMENNNWWAFVKNSKRLKLGDTIEISEYFKANVLKIEEGGNILLEFNSKNILEELEKHGELPLPPYIKRPHGNEESDSNHYQTVYAKNSGAVAAPTAGLHFTDELIEKLKKNSVEIVFVTLHVGAGTFLPIKTENIYDHKMHEEYAMISKEVAEKINKAKSNNQRIVAVGTTSVRVLESACNDDGIINEFSNFTSIYITPNYKFKIVDVLLTNFHLPKSTLFILVSAFAGAENIKKAYKYAIDNNYRFFSYGDACLLFKKE